jgi:hypothetical protein
MTSAGELLADLAARGVELRADGEALRYRPAFLVRRAEAEAMRQHKAELLALLAAGPVLTRCPNCGRPVDGRGRCPRCFDRLCVGCGRPTGSYCLQQCLVCEFAPGRTEEASPETMPSATTVREGKRGRKTAERHGQARGRVDHGEGGTSE